MDWTLEEKKSQSGVPENSYLNDLVVSEYYKEFFNALSSKDFDKQLNKGIKILAEAIKKTSPEKKEFYTDALSSIIEFYIENKIEKELDESFLKILNL